MANIELIIKIPEEIRLALINNIPLSANQWSTLDSYIEQAVINGIPLPKGHGRLIDISEYEKYSNTEITYDDGNNIHSVYTSMISTIIEADKVESEVKPND